MKLIITILLLFGITCDVAYSQNVSVAVFNYVGISNTNIVVQTDDSLNDNENISIEIIVAQKQLNVSGCLTNVSNSIPSSSSSSTGVSGTSSLQSSSLHQSSSIGSSSTLSSSPFSSSISTISSSLPFSSSSSLVTSSSKSVSSSSSSSSLCNGFIPPQNVTITTNSAIPITTSPMNLLFNQSFPINKTIYVNSQSGNDITNSGLCPTSAFQTIQRAQSLVQSFLSFNNQQSIVVFLQGTFILNSTLSFSQMDGPASTSNNYVIFTSLDSTTPTEISGGKLLPANWSELSSFLGCGSHF